MRASTKAWLVALAAMGIGGYMLGSRPEPIPKTPQAQVAVHNSTRITTDHMPLIEDITDNYHLYSIDEATLNKVLVAAANYQTGLGHLRQDEQGNLFLEREITHKGETSPYTMTLDDYLQDVANSLVPEGMSISDYKLRSVMRRNENIDSPITLTGNTQEKLIDILTFVDDNTIYMHDTEKSTVTREPDSSGDHNVTPYMRGVTGVHEVYKSLPQHLFDKGDDCDGASTTASRMFELAGIDNVIVDEPNHFSVGILATPEMLDAFESKDYQTNYDAFCMNPKDLDHGFVRTTTIEEDNRGIIKATDKNTGNQYIVIEPQRGSTSWPYRLVNKNKEGKREIEGLFDEDGNKVSSWGWETNGLPGLRRIHRNASGIAVVNEFDDGEYFYRFGEDETSSKGWIKDQTKFELLGN